MTSWELLGIDPTDNPSIIKKAYAKKLKVYHPEDDPEGYQRLREAYDMIMKQQKELARRKKKQSAEEQNKINKDINNILIHEENVEQSATEELIHPANFVAVDHLAESFHKKEALVDEFIRKVEMLYHDFPSRIVIDHWAELLNSDVIWNLELKRKLSFSLLDFFVEHHYLPKDIWRLLENSFQWKDEIQASVMAFQDQVSDKFFDYYKKQLDDSPGFDYQILLEVEDINYDLFLHYREEAVDALSTNNVTKAEEYMEKALDIFSNDPELLRMYGDILFRTNRFEAASQAFNRNLQLNWKDIDARIYLATILHKTKQLDESIEQCEKILSMNPNHLDTLILQGENYFRKGDLNRSREIFKQIQEIEQFDLEVETYLARIHSIMYNESRSQRAKNKRPPIKLIKKDLMGCSIVTKLTAYLFHLIRLRVIILFVLAAIVWNSLGDMLDFHPIVSAILIPIVLIMGDMQLDSSPDLKVTLCVLLWYIILFFMIKEAIRIHRAVRY
jgi:tetratricopeptide (TPR) repeat protein